MLKDKLKKRRWSIPRSLTLMLIPHSNQSIYKVRIPYILIKVSLAFSFCLIIFVLYFSTRYWQMKEELVELNELRKINDAQAAKLQLLEAESEKLQEKMAEIKHLEKDVREMLQRGEITSRSASVNTRKSNSITNNEQSALLSFLNKKSYREKKADWDKKYLATASANSALIRETGELKESLSLLKKDVAVKKAYLAAKPFGLPTKGRISSPYGSRRSPFSGRSDFHPGIDVAAPYGAPVVATGKGKVVFAGYKSGYGKTIIIEHPFGFRTVYAHNAKIKVKVGDQVSRGDCIALVGSTGASTGPHVHYEVFINGTRVDPADYIR
ncbi:murein DD-endopeptidase MepM/ murein hydrolase activator NlpD [Desulfohalotomaculum tongense]|uniref:peptidoglycan DD-metalloendopeptidase family protein n=1 Tax=Desulforadius tongensis TaxID=1216062 RepID=UPI001957D29F|nr:peptidoglycan DD-metalloendopeptidase family protein [Desulforadius tongensis]MBM7854389.1 murein DD-endopeptidase MepM/ murein hydrolase activator NlpD [Desulforadius tongensis]